MATKKEKVTLKAIEILENTPDGIHYSELVRKMKQAFPDIPTGTIQWAIKKLITVEPDKVYKPATGLFCHTTFRDKEISEIERKPSKEVERIKEKEFYQPFANYLKDELEECTEAIPLGGNKFKDKWGTPDVIGEREPRRSDIIKTSTEIVSAEIKANTKDLITAFGQACSYKLFSHKSYIVIPEDSSQDDIAKMEALCLIFGIGLILFDSNNVDDPRFEIRVRSIKHEPNMFFVNKYMKMIAKELF